MYVNYTKYNLYELNPIQIKVIIETKLFKLIEFFESLIFLNDEKK